ncbi:MAG TPA: polyprenyl synthetase family protein [Lactovum miscens]|uniref:polyprenyl synthetase family protein n=1 Tax=Lactovum miscens TaxID=190387 RepID=UPI002EDADBC3
MVVNYFSKEYPKLASDLNKVKRLMKKSVIIKNQDVKDAILNIFNAGGKMLRPAYLLLFSEFSLLEDKQKVALAAAIEMLHNATLIHDDIVDDADTRRGATTISKLYGADVAVYAGDYLFVSAFKTLSQQDFELSNLTDQTNSVERLLGGELGQMSKRFDLTQSIDDYVKNISGKTAELFALACSIPLMIDGHKKLAQRAFKIGREIGLAFQIMDDYLDYSSDSVTLGKPVLEDVKQGVYSAPVLFAFQADPEKVTADLKDKNFEAFYDFILSSGSLEKTKKLAKLHTDAALTMIAKLPRGETREKIADITSELLERKI